MKLHLEINGLKPIGLNHSHMITTIGRHARRIKTVETKNFEDKLTARLSQYQDEINKFNDLYDSSLFYLDISYRFYIPIMKKDGKSINMRSGDVDGLIKVTQDCIFNRLKADDSAICSLSASKIHSENYKIIVDISMLDIKHIQ